MPNFTTNFGLILSLYNDQEHHEYDLNWGTLDAQVNGGLVFGGVAPIAGQVLTATVVGGKLTAVWETAGGGGGGVSSFNGRVGVVSPLTGDYTVGMITGAAPLASPTFTGTVTLPAATYAISISGNAATAGTISGSITESQVTGLAASLAALAPLASPAFSGVPTAPTAAAGTDSTQVATTAYADNSAATGGGKLQHVRSVDTSFTQAGITGPTALTFATPFADDNYTVQVTVVGDEVAPETPTMVRFPALGISYITKQTPAGTGVNVWIANNDSGAHSGVIHVTAWHD